MATTMNGSVFINSKKISISAKRQITIPQKFFYMLGFDSEAECMVRGNELIIRPVKANSSGEFAEQILADLIKEGYSEQELLDKFKQRQRNVRLAIENMLVEAKNAADGNGEYLTMDDVFGTEE